MKQLDNLEPKELKKEGTRLYKEGYTIDEIVSRLLPRKNPAYTDDEVNVALYSLPDPKLVKRNNILIIALLVVLVIAAVSKIVLVFELLRVSASANIPIALCGGLVASVVNILLIVAVSLKQRGGFQICMFLAIISTVPLLSGPGRAILHPDALSIILQGLLIGLPTIIMVRLFPRLNFAGKIKHRPDTGKGPPKCQTKS